MKLKLKEIRIIPTPQGIEIIRKTGHVPIVVENGSNIIERDLIHPQMLILKAFKKKINLLWTINRDLKYRSIDWSSTHILFQGSICKNRLRGFISQKKIATKTSAVEDMFLEYGNVLFFINIFNDLEIDI